MPAPAHALAGRTVTAPHAAKRQGAVPLSFWATALAATVLGLAGVPLDGQFVTAAALLLILIGGLPHGGYDLAVAHRLFAVGGWRLTAFIGLYIGVAAMMLSLWQTVPLVALAIFIILSAVHFGDDWPQLKEGLLRMCAGASVIVAPAIGQPEAVADLFMALAGRDAIWLARAAMAVAPVVLLVTVVAIAIAWTIGQRARALALLAALILLIATPPLVGFAMFFTLLHAPRHMETVRERIILHGWTAWSGGLLAIASVLMWWMVGPDIVFTLDTPLSASAFQLLSVLAAPHLVCSHLLDRLEGARR